MEHPWFDRFIRQSAPAEDTPPDETTGTNEPVDVPADDPSVSPDEQPNPDLAQDIADMPATDTGAEAPSDAGTDALQSQIDELKKQLEDLQTDYDTQGEIDELKKRIDNLRVPDDIDMNDSLFQSAAIEINYLKRACRRLNRKCGLTGSQRTLINMRLEQHPTMSNQEIAAELASIVGAKQQDIFEYIMNSEFRFRHRHGPHASIIDWDAV
ncbi:MAG: hypothetical protein PHF86_06625 [Candidatus Nanoarchaeia archaeon]|jgi:hypothetical protein|nr:hypothetical protein [Candidatus Nanoarchaeia archaeon]